MAAKAAGDRIFGLPDAEEEMAEENMERDKIIASAKSTRAIFRRFYGGQNPIFFL